MKNAKARIKVARRCTLWRACRNPELMARNSGSGGSRVVFPSVDERHQIRAATTPAVVSELTQNGAAMPHAAITIPARAGPSARLTFKPTLLSATADWRRGRGTSSGTTACHAGMTSAAAVAREKAEHDQSAG